MYLNLNERILEETKKKGNSKLMIGMKVLSLALLWGVCFFFAVLPYYSKKFRENTTCMSYINAFAGGLFFGVSFFQLLPEANENLEEGNSSLYKVGLSYYIIFASYSIVLFLEKIAFNRETKPKVQNEKEDDDAAKSQSEAKKCSTREQTAVEPVNPRPAIAVNTHVFEPINDLGADNKQNQEADNKAISNPDSPANVQTDVPVNVQGNEPIATQGDVPITTQSNLDSTKKEVENSNKERSEAESKEDENVNHIKPIILLASLGFDSFFEGVTLGIMGKLKNLIFLLVALIAHKWAESLTLGVNFIQCGLNKKKHIMFSLIFSLIAPIGLILGLVLSSFNNNPLVVGIFLSISTGTFIYFTCSEVISEEFEDQTNKFKKFLFYIGGAVLCAGISIFEYYVE